MLPLSLENYVQTLMGRVMIVSRYQILPVEAIVRGYMAGNVFNYIIQSKLIGIQVLLGKNMCSMEQYMV